MIQFLADNIDQLDLALDQLAICDRNFDRFALMLVDNVVELTLHRFIQDKANENEMWGRFSEPKYDPKLIQKGLGQNFDSKAKVARNIGFFDKSLCESILNLHSYRNSSYHQGLRHEAILHSLAMFYFKCSCEVLKAYEPQMWSWSSNDKISYRAKKYLGDTGFMNHKAAFQAAYVRLSEVVSSMENTLIHDLTEDMRSTIDSTDDAIKFLSTDGQDNKNRDEVVIYSQAWPFSFTDEGKNFAHEGGYSNQTVGGLVDWLTANYNWPVPTDPIPSWRSRLNSLSNEKEEHKALKKYCDFMRQTESIRSQIDESAFLLDGHIQQQIDIMRGK